MKNLEYCYINDIIRNATDDYSRISQEEIAERMGVSRQMIYYYNKGLFVTPAVIRDLSHATNIWIGSFAQVGGYNPEIIIMDKYYEPDIRLDVLWKRFAEDRRNDIRKFESSFNIGEESVFYMENNDPRAFNIKLKAYQYMLDTEQPDLDDIFHQGKWSYPGVDLIRRDMLDAEVRENKASYSRLIDDMAEKGEISRSAQDKLQNELKKY